MAAGVQEHVRQSVSDFPRRPKDASVEPRGDHRSAATERPVHRARDAGAKGHHAATESLGIHRFDEEMRVRGLQRVVHEAEVAAVAGCREAAFERADEGHGSQRWESGEKLDGHVYGEAVRDSCAPPVRNARLRSGLASSAVSAAAPPETLLQAEPELRTPRVHRQLEWGVSGT
jgi:hypothetical protein